MTKKPITKNGWYELADGGWQYFLWGALGSAQGAFPVGPVLPVLPPPEAVAYEPASGRFLASESEARQRYLADENSIVWIDEGSHRDADLAARSRS